MWHGGNEYCIPHLPSSFQLNTSIHLSQFHNIQQFAMLALLFWFKRHSVILASITITQQTYYIEWKPNGMAWCKWSIMPQVTLIVFSVTRNTDTSDGMGVLFYTPGGGVTRQTDKIKQAPGNKDAYNCSKSIQCTKCTNALNVYITYMPSYPRQA